MRSGVPAEWSCFSSPVPTKFMCVMSFVVCAGGTPIGTLFDAAVDGSRRISPHDRGDNPREHQRDHEQRERERQCPHPPRGGRPRDGDGRRIPE